MEWTGMNKVLKPIDNMSLVIDHMSKTIAMVMGKTNAKGVYYDKLFEEYRELERILRNKSNH